MTIAEAIQKLDDHMWIRPMTWEGLGQALTIQGGLMMVVPGKRGGAYWHPYACELLAEWEVVAPKDVCEEVIR